jgi:hypothetical protein
MLTAQCPLGAALTAVPETSCPVDFGQIAKIAFQQVQSVSTFTAATIKVKANWTAALAASDATKIVLTPIVGNLVIPKSEILKEGGNDNTTFNGMPKVNGLGFVEVSCLLRSISDATKQALQALFAYSQIIPGDSTLCAYFLTSDNKVISGAAGVAIPVFAVAVSDVGTEGFGKNNECDLKFFMQGGWSDGVIATAATDFKTLTLVNPT